jgi:anti-sigma regulatory factor (Ser/Thr protein kinase)
MKDVLRLHIPSSIKYTRLVEDFTRSTMEYIYPDDENIRNQLCAVMNEVFVNIVEHSNTSNIDELVRVQFEIGENAFMISIFDFGPGIKINNYLPPYDKRYIGEKYEFRKVVDGVVYAKVINPFSISFTFEEHPDPDTLKFNRLDEIQYLQGHGLGVSIMTKIMDSVTYSFIGEGKYDWLMVKNFDSSTK